MSEEALALINLKITRDKHGELVGTPTYSHGNCHLHPIPRKLQGEAERLEMEGKRVTGYLSSSKKASVKDKKGKDIFIEPFVPMALSDKEKYSQNTKNQ